MTGLEPAALGAAAVNAVEKITRTDPDVKPELISAAVAHPAFDAAAGALARRTAVKERIKLMAWRPLGWLFRLNTDYFEEDFHSDLADAMADVPPEDVIAPAPSVAGPSIQGLLFTLDEPTLKNMYITLLASASDRRVSADAHPAYAEIIRQLSAEEAELLRRALRGASVPIINVKIRTLDQDGNMETSFTLGARHLLNWMQDRNQYHEYPRAPLFLENWIRLGLVEISYFHHLSHPGMYDWAEQRPEVIRLRSVHDTEEHKRIEIEQGVLTVTDFGRRFAAVAVPEPAGVVDADPDLS